MEISKVNLIFSMDEMDGKGEINVLEVAEVLSVQFPENCRLSKLCWQHSEAGTTRQVSSGVVPSYQTRLDWTRRRPGHFSKYLSW